MFDPQKKHFQWVLVLIFSVGIGSFLQFKAIDLQTSVIPTKQAMPFNGTVFPLPKVPNWIALTKEEWNLPYDQIPVEKKISMPTYDLNQLGASLTNVGWSKESDKALRNLKIIYSTPYMWGYGKPGGSHLAVDIKTSDSTPVVAIGNGVVVKVSTQTTGFGQHIVVKHENFPAFDDPSKKTTYYSSYNHLGKILVAEGDVVQKGQQIALSGHTGTSTTPHLHFQIDNDQAPWHPYWPFTYQESNAAGLSFDEAVTTGLGRNKALATTIDPILYVQKYLDDTSLPVVSAPSVPASPEVVPSPTPVPVPTPTPNITPPPASNTNISSTPEITNTPVPSISTVTPDTATTESAFPDVPASPATAFKLIADNTFTLGTEGKLLVKAVDAQGDIVKNYKPKYGVYVSLELGGATLKKNYFEQNEFVDGVVNVNFVPVTGPSLRFKAYDGEISGLSDVLQGDVFSDVSTDTELGTAITFLKKNNLINGYADKTFRPNQIVTRAEAVKFIYGVSKQRLVQDGTTPFKDVLLHQWYTPYILTAYQKKVVNGYIDKTFKPQKNVVRGEFLKMFFLAMDLKPVVASTSNTFEDVPVNSWPAAYVQYASDKNLMTTQGKVFGVNTEMTRGEVAQLMYRFMVLKLSGEQHYTPGLALSEDAIREYFGKSS